MRRKKANKHGYVHVVLLLGLSIMALGLLPGSITIGQNPANEVGGAGVNVGYEVEHNKQEAPANHEPVFMSVFKFIVNCNPFKKETSLSFE